MPHNGSDVASTFVKQTRKRVSMNIAQRDQNGICILALEGNLDTNTAPNAQETIDKLIDGGTKELVLNFAEIRYVSSAGLRVLLATAKRLRKEEGKLHLCGLNEMVQEVFEISGFCSIFNISTSEDEALAAF